MKIAVLLTCFNRQEKTLACLTNLYANETAGFELDIFLVDDGCTDGTAETVIEKYPSVNVIQGTGSLYWNGGMRLAWEAALNKQYDFYLWINDDSEIYPDAIARIIFAYDQLILAGKRVGAVLGTMVDPASKMPTYGGRLRNSLINPLSFGPVLVPTDEPLACDFINGNFTLIPKESVKRIGILSNKYTHSMGDFDYGLRLKKSGLTCWVAPGTYGECETNSNTGGCKDKSLAITERVEKMNSISQLPPIDEWLFFVREHGGYIWPLLWFKAKLRKVFPHLWVFLRSK